MNIQSKNTSIYDIEEVTAGDYVYYRIAMNHNDLPDLDFNCDSIDLTYYYDGRNIIIRHAEVALDNDNYLDFYIEDTDRFKEDFKNLWVNLNIRMKSNEYEVHMPRIYELTYIGLDDWKCACYEDYYHNIFKTSEKIYDGLEEDIQELRRLGLYASSDNTIYGEPDNCIDTYTFYLKKPQKRYVLSDQLTNDIIQFIKDYDPYQYMDGGDDDEKEYYKLKFITGDALHGLLEELQSFIDDDRNPVAVQTATNLIDRLDDESDEITDEELVEDDNSLEVSKSKSINKTMRTI